ASAVCVCPALVVLVKSWLGVAVTGKALGGRLVGSAASVTLGAAATAVGVFWPVITAMIVTAERIKSATIATAMMPTRRRVLRRGGAWDEKTGVGCGALVALP